MSDQNIAVMMVTSFDVGPRQKKMVLRLKGVNVKTYYAKTVFIPLGRIQQFLIALGVKNASELIERPLKVQLDQEKKPELINFADYPREWFDLKQTADA